MKITLLPTAATTLAAALLAIALVGTAQARCKVYPTRGENRSGAIGGMLDSRGQDSIEASDAHDCVRDTDPRTPPKPNPTRPAGPATTPTTPTATTPVVGTPGQTATRPPAPPLPKVELCDRKPSLPQCRTN